MTFAVRRARQQTARLLLVLLSALLVVLGVGGMEVLSARLVDDGLRTVAGRAEPGTQVATVTALQLEDAGAQDRAVRSAIAEAFGAAPVAVARLAVSGISLGNPDAVQAMSGSDAMERGSLVDGAWPSRAGEAAVLAAAAKRRGWRVGDRIALGADPAGAAAEVSVVGIWTANDPADPVWAGDPAVASGDSGGAAGPVLVTDDTLGRLSTTPSVTWTIRPTVLTAGRLDAYRAGLDRLQGLAASVDPDNRSSTTVSGGLAALLDRATRAVTVTRGTMTVPTAIIVLLGAIALIVILAALASGRRDELRLLRARGAAVRDLAGGAAVEAGGASGAGVVAALLVLLPWGPFSSTTLVVAVSTVLTAVVAAAVAAARDSATAAATRVDAGRGTAVALLLPAFLAALVAGFALWQLFAQGGVLDADGRADPVASASGAAALLALALLVPVLAVLIAALAERVARRGRGIVPVLPLRQIARRAGATAVAILCAALAAGSVTLAVGAGPLAAQADRAAVRAGLGLDVRATAGVQSAPPLSADEAARLPSVARATEVLGRDAEVGADTVAFVAADSTALTLPVGVPAALHRDTGALPIAVTQALADRLGARAGTRFTATLRPEGVPVDMDVVAVVAALPGIGSGFGILAERASALRAEDGITANGLWIAASDPAAVAEAIRARATDPVTILTARSVSVAPVTDASVLVLVVGALGAALLGALGFAAAVAVDRSRRTEERVALRALGLTAARQRTARAGEVLGIALAGVLGGVAAGLLVTAAVLPVMWGIGA